MENKSDHPGLEGIDPGKKKTPIILIWLVMLLIAGSYVRFYDLGDQPLDFHPTRQLHSLIIARGIYYQHAPGIGEDQRQAAWQQAQAEGQVEPPILEWITSQTYRIIGGESHVVARVYSILFWIAGGIVLFFFSRRYLPGLGSLATLGFYLLIPFGVYASRSFQPDPLMTLLCILSWFLFARWLEKPGWGSAILTGLVGGMALLVKTTAVFYLAGAFIGMFIAVRRWAVLKSAQVWFMLLLMALPAFLYSVTVWLDPAAGGGIASLRFFPSYWTKIEWYLTWYNLLDRHIGSLWIVLSLIGGLALPPRLMKGLYWGGWSGYVLMGFVLPHHISTHDYYLLPLLPLIGLGLAGLALIAQNEVVKFGRFTRWSAAGLLLALVMANVYSARTALNKADYRQEPERWREIADELASFGPVTGLTQDYGLRLTYWGGMSITNWFTADEIRLRLTSGQEIDMASLFAEKTESAGAFLVTMPEEFERQPELRQMLDGHFPQVSPWPDVWLYDLRAGTVK